MFAQSLCHDINGQLLESDQLCYELASKGKCAAAAVSVLAAILFDELGNTIIMLIPCLCIILSNTDIFTKCDTDKFKSDHTVSEPAYWSLLALCQNWHIVPYSHRPLGPARPWTPAVRRRPTWRPCCLFREWNLSTGRPLRCAPSPGSAVPASCTALLGRCRDRLEPHRKSNMQVCVHVKGAGRKFSRGGQVLFADIRLFNVTHP